MRRSLQLLGVATAIGIAGTIFLFLAAQAQQGPQEWTYQPEAGENRPKAMAMYQHAIQAFQAGDHNTCLSLCKAALVLDHGNKHLVHLQALAYAQAGDNYNANMMFRSALTLDYNFLPCRNNYGMFMQKTGKVDEAQHMFEECIRIDPKYPEAYYHLGDILRGKGDLDHAIENFESATRLNPNYFEAQQDLGLAIYERAEQGLGGIISDSMEALQKAARLVPDNPMIWYHIGVIYCSEGKLDEAESMFRTALMKDPKLAAAHWELARIRYLRGDPDRCTSEILYSGSAKGRPTVPARVMAAVMLLQSFEGLSDREACDRLEADLRWQAAAGTDVGGAAFHPTALVGMRNRLRASARPRRLFEDTKVVARATGAMKNRARVLDSTPVLDAVATQDTVTQLRAAIRKVLSALDKAGSPAASQIRAVLRRDDDYAAPGKPPCDWDDPAAREVLVDELVKDALAALRALDGQMLPLPAAEAAGLLALVAGQDVDEGGDGVFRIARRVARDRVISTVDAQARHGHKSRNRRFDGYKAHLSVDPDSELIDEVAATAANAPDRDAAAGLLSGLAGERDKPEVVGDSAYGDAATRAGLEARGFTVIAKCPPSRNAGGRFSKDQFAVNPERGTVTCPAGRTAVIVVASAGGGRASFRPWCATCPLRTACTTSPRGRTITIHPQEAILQRARATQRDPAWQHRYRTDRPVVERKISHFTRRPWGGRKARTRGLARITTDLYARAAAINWARLAILGLHHDHTSWALSQT